MKSANPGFMLFDPEYYVATYPDIQNLESAWEHFLTVGAKGGRSPHVLFDTLYYLRRNPDVEARGLNPLDHYVKYGAFELRNAHPLFDERLYLEEHPEVRVIGMNPLMHFLERGARARYNPNRLFNVEFYLRENPDVAAAGVNPLIHYIQAGASEGRDPHPLFGTRDYLHRYPDVSKSGINPLRYHLEHGEREGKIISRPLLFSERKKDIASNSNVVERKRSANPLELNEPLPVFCVYGPSNVQFLKDIVIPGFAHQTSPVPLELHFLNYRSRENPVDWSSCLSEAVVGITDWSGSRPAGHLGFGENMNYLFQAVSPRECFLYCNPDSFPMADCVSRLIDCYTREGAAIVEASQWPSPHPKELDLVTHETPWASGAFGLISAEAFKELKGFDPTYFLYLEDVDLSWRAWLKGFRVLHEPLAHCGHATGLHSYRKGRFYYEHFFSLRNFIVISYKFFGEDGESTAIEYIKAALLPKPLHTRILESYQSLRSAISVQRASGQNADKIKILGLNLFHELRQ